MTEACIVGWAHSPFGKLEDPDIESLIGRVAGSAIEDAGIAPGEIEASFISLFKDTSVLSVITVAELMKYTGDIISVTFRPFTFYLIAAFIYWGLCLLYEYGIHRRVEARFKKAYRPAF